MHCRCGLTLRLSSTGLKFCENCDRLQPQELLQLPRHRTPNDVKFDVMWTLEMREYPPIPDDVDLTPLYGLG